MSYLVLMCVALLMIAAFVALGPRETLWYGWPFALLLVPTWWQVWASSLILDSHTVAAPIIALALLTEGHTGPRSRLMISDVLVVLLVVSMTISARLSPAHEFGMTTIPTHLLRYFLPYLLGRRFFRSRDEVGRSMGMMAACCGLLTLYAIGESLTRINPLASLTGHVFHFIGAGAIRHGLRRAQGPYRHPIYMGMVLIMLLPWALETSRRARARDGPAWWRALPWLTGAGVFFTITRSAWLAGVEVMMIRFILTRRRGRALLMVLVCLGGIAMSTSSHLVIEFIEHLAGHEEGREIIINGEPYVYTGGRHRLLLFTYYGEDLANAGWFGYGLTLPIESHEKGTVFYSIDSHYIMWTLQYGYAGLTLFALLELTVCYYALRIAWPRNEPCAPLAGVLFGVLLGTGANLFTVSLVSDFGDVWFFTAGVAAALYDVAARREPMPKPTPGGAPALGAPPGVGTYRPQSAGWAS